MRDYNTLIARTDPAYQAWLAGIKDDIVIGNDVVCLYSRELIPERNEINEMESYLPNHLLIGDDSGDMVFVLELNAVGPVWRVDVGSLRVEDFEEISPLFSAWQESRFALPQEKEYRLPLYADIHIDYVKDLNTMFTIKNFLSLNWGASQMKSLLHEQPFLAIKRGAPIAIEQRLKKNHELNHLKQYLFFDNGNTLEQICS